MRRWVMVGLVVAMMGAASARLVSARAATAAPGAVPTPSVTGPISGGLHGRPQTASYADLAQRGYLEQEFFVSGTATAYGGTTTILPDGAVPPPHAGATAPYKTRVLVRRPADPRAFSGTVVVEWLNVTAQVEADPEWSSAYDRLFIPKGWAWVGVSAQKAGVDGPSPLSHKNWDPVRYASLTHPGDLYSYDIFTQAAKAAITGARLPLGGLRPSVVIGTGDSQSADLLNGYLSGYYQKSMGIFDAFGPSAATVTATHVPVPTIWNNSQNETTGGSSVPDTPFLRVWEVAGASHADDHAVKEGVFSRAGYDETGQPSVGAALAYDTTLDYQSRQAGQPCPVGQTNLFPYRYIYPVKYALLDRWVRMGRAAPKVPRQTRTPAGGLAYDADGNVVGGFRLPVIEVPVATYTTQNCPPLAGTSFRFSQARLLQLYPSHAAYVAKMKAATDGAVNAGLLFGADAEEIMAIAESSPIPAVGSSPVAGP